MQIWNSSAAIQFNKRIVLDNIVIYTNFESHNLFLQASWINHQLIIMTTYVYIKNRKLNVYTIQLFICQSLKLIY